MLKIHSSNQTSFFGYCLDDALSKNEMLFKIDAILKETPNLLDPFIDRYLKDRKEKEIDINFGKPTIALESFVRLLLLKHLHKNCDYREVESRAKTDYARKAFARMSVIDTVPDYTTLIKREEFFGEKTIRILHGNIIGHFRKKKDHQREKDEDGYGRSGSQYALSYRSFHIIRRDKIDYKNGEKDQGNG